MSFKLTYFDIQGAAEKVRLAFVLSGIPFEDDRINPQNWYILSEIMPAFCNQCS